MNKSTRAAISFDLVSRGFGFYSTIVGLALMISGFYIGTSQSAPSQAGLFGVIVIYIFNFCDFYQWLLRQIITSESLLISYERAVQIANLQPER